MAKNGDKKKRYDRATNELIILEFINKYGKKNGGYPQLETIKKGVSEYMGSRTVDRIIADIDIFTACDNHPSRLKLGEFINSMCQLGLAGNIPAAKLWLALAFGWHEKTKIEIKKDPGNKSKFDYSILSVQELKTLEALLTKIERPAELPITINFVGKSRKST